MKAIALVLSFCFSLNVLAAHGTIQELEKSFDNYTYAVTVEWDQKDNDFYQAATKNLFKELDALVKSGDVTKEDILALAEKKIGNKQSFEAIKAKLNLSLNSAMSTEEVVRVLQDQSSSFYDRGASWSGDVWTIGGIVAGLALVTFLIILGSKAPTEKCVETATVQQCGWYTPAQNIPPRWDCYYEYVCTKWEPINP